MKALALFLALCLIGAREMNAAKQVVIVTNSPPGVVRLSTNLTEFAEAALSADDAKKADIIQLIAWAAKSSDVFLPPQLGEEVLVLVHWNEEGTKGRWCLAHVMRSSGEGPGSWKRWSCQPVFPTRMIYESEPSDDEIAQFIRATSFGYNEHDPNIHVLRVTCYRDAQPIVKTLMEGIPESEKSERFAKLLSVFGHHRP